MSVETRGRGLESRAGDPESQVGLPWAPAREADRLSSEQPRLLGQLLGGQLALPGPSAAGGANQGHVPCLPRSLHFPLVLTGPSRCSEPD